MSLLPLLLISWIGTGNVVPAEASTPGASVLHPNSFSSLVFHVEDQGVQMEWWIQSRTLMEEPELGFDCEDLWLATPLETEAAWPAIQAYLEEGFTIRVDGELWQPEFAEYTLEEEGFTLKVETYLPRSARAEKLEVRVDHFFDGSNPEHYVAIDVHGMAEEADRWILMWGKREASFPVVPVENPWDAEEEEPLSTFAQYFTMGREHVLGGLDHLAFLLALLFGVANLRALIAAITGFTISHSITLGLGTYGVLNLSPRWVEPGISFSISAALWWHLARGPEKSRTWLLAFAFGLLHGSSFAASLRHLPQGDVLESLLAFNLGVEFGQLLFIMPLVLAGLTIHRMLPHEQARHQARHYAALLLGAFALVLFGDSLVNFAGWSIEALPESFAPLPGAVGLALAIAIVTRGRQDCTGRPLAPQAFGCAALAALYSAGNWLGS